MTLFQFNKEYSKAKLVLRGVAKWSGRPDRDTIALKHEITRKSSVHSGMF